MQVLRIDPGQFQERLHTASRVDRRFDGAGWDPDIGNLVDRVLVTADAVPGGRKLLQKFLNVWRYDSLLQVRIVRRSFDDVQRTIIRLLIGNGASAPRRLVGQWPITRWKLDLALKQLAFAPDIQEDLFGAIKSMITVLNATQAPAANVKDGPPMSAGQSPNG